MERPLLEINGLKIYFMVKSSGPRERKKQVKAVDGVSFSVNRHETFGIVGESGCGKTTTGKAILQLIKPTSGEILYDGKNLSDKRNRKETLELKREIQIIFQDPFSSLDPRFTVGKFIAEPLVVHKIGTKEERRQRVLELMKEVGLREDQYDRFPHEFSGGQRQRIGIARALALNPSLIVCDEPVSALDVSIQAQVLNLMKTLQKKYGLTYIFISHNLSVVKHICDRIGVMYLGNLVEIAKKEQLFENPRHPYTSALLDAIPIPDPDVKTMTQMLTGDVPSAMDPPGGCCFHTRCKYAKEICSKEKPPLKEIESGHCVACHLV